jgi:hypothetical protein
VTHGQCTRLPRWRAFRSDHAAAHLIELDRFEQRLEIALAEALVALALDDLEEYRPENIGREDLQQNAILRRAIDQNAPTLKLGQVLLVARDAARNAVLVGVGRILEDDAAGP